MKTSKASVLILSLTCSSQRDSFWVSKPLLLKDLQLIKFSVNARAFETDLPVNLNILLHAFRVSQKRWRLARKAADAPFEPGIPADRIRHSWKCLAGGHRRAQCATGSSLSTA